MTRNAVLIAISIVAGCGGSPGTHPALGPTRGFPQTQSRSVEPHVDASRCRGPVVYVSGYDPNGGNAPVVQIYEQRGPSTPPCGSISGFIQAEGLFVDAGDDLWVADIQARQIFKFSPGSSIPSLTLNDPEGAPFGVAIDNRTGRVFVANLFNNSGSGSVEVYAKGATTPEATLTQSVANSLTGVDLDERGNLYVGYITHASGTGGILRWRRGRGQPTDLNIQLSAPDTVETTASGALFVCNGGGAPGCGEVLPGSHSLSGTFDQIPGSDHHGALNREESRAFTVANFASDEGEVWNFPGPDSQPLKILPAVCSGCFGIGVATKPAPRQGEPF